MASDKGITWQFMPLLVRTSQDALLFVLITSAYIIPSGMAQAIFQFILSFSFA